MVMPCASVRIVAPSLAFDAVFTAPASLDDADELDVELGAAVVAELWLLELPHAESASDATSVGKRNFSVGRIGAPLTDGCGNRRLGNRSVHRAGSCQDSTRGEIL